MGEQMTFEERLKYVLGEMTFQLAALQHKLQQAEAEKKVLADAINEIDQTSIETIFAEKME